MNKTRTTSESLVASLCRELDHIQIRIKSIHTSLISCRDERLLLRLSNELKDHEERKNTIRRIANKLNEINKFQDLSIKFLLEISNRTTQKV